MMEASPKMAGASSAVKMGDAATTPSMELHSGGYVVFMVRVWKPPMMISMGHLQNS